jgi:WD40 repeat protein
MNSLNLYDFNTQSTNQLMPQFQGTIRDIKRFKSNYVAAGALDGTLQEWDLEDFTNLPVTIREPYGILNLDFTSTGDTLATSGRENAFRIWRNFGIDTISQIIDVRVRQVLYVQVKTDKNLIILEILVVSQFYSIQNIKILSQNFHYGISRMTSIFQIIFLQS